MSSCIVFDERLTTYNFGHAHPMAPVRVELTVDLAREFGLFEDGLECVGASPADDEMLSRLHKPDYIEAVHRASVRPDVAESVWGLGTPDNPAFAHMHEASALIAGASIEAARRVWTGQARHAVNISGGLHHAMPGAASGFCVYNDVALAIAWLLDQGAQRVAYIDVDAHHGDGVQAMFWDDPRVLTVSIHESPQTLFPGTGYATEVGPPGAEGTSVNIAVPPGTADAGWLRAFNAVVPDVVRQFRPDILVTQQGCDSHMDDPLTNLMLSVDGQRASYLLLRDLADELCEGRWVATGGGGYAVTEVVPRAWAHLLAIVARKDIDPSEATPELWRKRVAEIRGFAGPSRMTDGREPLYRPWSEGYNPDTWLDQLILQSRREVFPHFGLDPEF